jgi:chemotaxis protein MotB
MNAKTFLILLLGAATVGCATNASRGPNETALTGAPAAGAQVSSAEAQQLLALQQERQQLLATLADFHERVRDLESKLADREGKPIAKSYDQLLAIKEAELSELRKAAVETGALVAQRDVAATQLAQAKQRLAALEQQAAQKDQELASLRGPTATAADLDAAKRRVIELQAQLLQRDTETRTLRGAAAEREGLATQLQTVTVALNHTKDRLASVEKQLTQKDQDLRTHASEKQRLSAESASHAADLKLARQRITLLEHQAMEKDQQLQILTRSGSDRDKLASQLSALNMDLAQSKQQTSQLERRLAAKGQEMEALQSLITEKDKLLRQTSPQKAMTGQHPVATEQPARNAGSQMSAFGKAVIPHPGASSGATRPSQDVAGTRPADHQPRLHQTKEELVRTLQNEMARGSVMIKQEGNQLSVSLSSALLFSSGEVALKPDGMMMLRRIGQLLGQALDRAIQVTGHTDNHPVSKDLRKSFPDNRALSWARADSARKALISGGTPPEQVRAVGLADKQPLASNTTEAGRQKNRRIEIIVTQFSIPSRTVTPGPGRSGPNMAALSMPNRHEAR